jgi:hypothetical protein
MLHPDQEKDGASIEGKETTIQMVIRTQDENGEPITAVVDSTGLTTTTKGAYIEAKWKKEKEKISQIAHSC